MKKISILLLLLTAITFGACKKHVTQENKKTFKTMNGTFVNMPSVEDGILTFADEDQYHAYVQMLKEQIIEQADLEIDDVLWSIEEPLGFTNSLRKIKADAYEAQNAIGWDKLEDVPVQEFDKIEMSIMNQYNEYKIGSDIYKSMGQYDIIIKGDDQAKAAEILGSSRVMQEGNPTITLSQIRSLNWSMKNLIITDTKINGWEIMPSGGGQPLSQYELSGHVHSMNECGGALNKATIRSMTLINTTNPNTPLVGYYDVDYGDGSGYTNYPGAGGMFGVELYDEHQYATSGTYTITIKARAVSNGPIVVQQSYTITVAGNTTCTNESKSQSYTWEIDPNHKVLARIWTKKRNHLLQGPCADGKAEMSFYVYSSNKWKNRKAQGLGINLFSYAYKNESGPCTLYGATPEASIWLPNVDDVNVNRKYCDAGLTRTTQVKWVTVEGTFKVTFDNTTYTKKYIMSSCN